MDPLQPINEISRLSMEGRACADSTSMAERELEAFLGAATRLLGSNQVRYMEDLWLDELATMDYLPRPASCEWRLVTVAASVRLAKQLIHLCVREDIPADRSEAETAGTASF